MSDQPARTDSYGTPLPPIEESDGALYAAASKQPDIGAFVAEVCRHGKPYGDGCGSCDLDPVGGMAQPDTNSALEKAFWKSVEIVGAQPDSGAVPEFMARLPEVAALAHGAGVHCAGDAIVYLQSALTAAQQKADDTARGAQACIRQLQAELTAAQQRIAARPYPAPLAAEINALPEHVRSYLHDLETRADPSGDLVAVRAEQDNVRGLSAMVRRLQSSLTAAQQRETALRAALTEHIAWMTELRDSFRREGVIDSSEAAHMNRLLARSGAALANKNAVDNLPNGNLPSGDI